MDVGKEEDMKQTSAMKVIKEEEMLNFEQKFKTFVDQKIIDSINQTETNFSSLIKNSEDALKKEIQKQKNIIEDLRKVYKNMEDLNSDNAKHIEKEVKEIREKVMTKLCEQMNMLMVKVGCLEEKNNQVRTQQKRG